MSKRLTVKQHAFVKEYIGNGGNGTQAAINTYNAKNNNVAHVIASENLRKPTIQQEIRQALEVKGLTPESIAEYLKKNIVAGVGVKATASDSLRGIDLYAKLTGAYETSTIEQTYRVKLQKMDTKELSIELEKHKKLSSQLQEELDS